MLAPLQHLARDPALTRAAHARRTSSPLIEEWSLEDGRSVTIRPVLPQDDRLAQAFVRGMSAQSRYNRFLVALQELPPALLARFTNVDQQQHLALLAATMVYGKELQIGEARYVIEAGGTSAEFAIAVADDWQSAGIGSRLLRALEGAAIAAGVARLTGDVLVDNRKALDFMRQRGFIAHPNREEARLMRVEKALPVAPRI